MKNLSPVKAKKTVRGLFETAQRKAALSSCADAQNHKCSITKEGKCCNAFSCRNKFDNTEHSLESVEVVRAKIWKQSVGPKHRKNRLIKLLMDMVVIGGDGRRTIQYRCNGVRVCKDYMKSAVGCEPRFFNSCASFCLGIVTKRSVTCAKAVGRMGGHMSAPVEASDPLVTDAMREEAEIQDKDYSLNSVAAADVLSFLHSYFGGSVDCAPEERRDKYSQLNWREIWVKYKREHCKILVLQPVSYSFFCWIRAHKTPHYKRCRTSKKGGWNHLTCKTCDNLKRLIAKCGDEESRKKYQARLQKHREYQEGHRNFYYNTRAKAVRNSAYDVSIIVDAAGGAGSTHSPRYRTTEKGEPPRHTLMKVKNTFAKIHGVGTIVVQTLPDIEMHGGNLTVEVINLAVQEALKHRKGRPIRNLYVQLDNVNSNKCKSVIAGMAALCLLGIVRKVKLSYLIVGHTHEDIDACIGNVVSHIRGQDMPTYAKFREECINAIRKEGGSILDIVRVIGITDFDKMYKDVDVGNIKGISSAHSIRITAKVDGSGVNIYYKPDSTQVGWFPRPVAPAECVGWRRNFQHPNKKQVLVERIVQMMPLTEKGRRQEWHYDVAFSDGEVHPFTLPCPSLPLQLDLETAIGNIKDAKMQQFQGKMMEEEKREGVLHNIKNILTQRGDEIAIDEWDNFFSHDLPSIKAPEIYSRRAYKNVLAKLAESAGGSIRVPAVYDPGEPDHPDSYCDPITFSYGPMSYNERKTIMTNRGDWRVKGNKRGKKRKLADEDVCNYGDEACQSDDELEDVDEDKACHSEEEEDMEDEVPEEEEMQVEEEDEVGEHSIQLAAEMRHLVGAKFVYRKRECEVHSVVYDEEYETVVGYPRSVTTGVVSDNGWCVFGKDGLLERIEAFATDAAAVAVRNSMKRQPYTYEVVVEKNNENGDSAPSKRARHTKKYAE